MLSTCDGGGGGGNGGGGGDGCGGGCGSDVGGVRRFRCLGCCCIGYRRGSGRGGCVLPQQLKNVVPVGHVVGRLRPVRVLMIQDLVDLLPVVAEHVLHVRPNNLRLA